ncbi:MAG: hypothetical protein U9Q82_11230 [Chloroflexota bacterium]|nr:hypothetical protein [Chloroflexota bacterium]
MPSSDSTQLSQERRYIAYGSRIHLHSDNPSLLDAATAHLPLGWVPLTSPPSGGIEGGQEVEFVYRLQQKRGEAEAYQLFYNDELLSQRSHLPQLLTIFENHAELYSAYHAKDYLFIHAGVVGWQGQAILIPGRSMSGKTSLTDALIHAGATYYSDEFALIDPEGFVHPYPVPLSIRKDGALVGEKHALEKLGIQPGTTPLPVGLILIAKYQRYARWKPETLSPAETMLSLMDNAVAANRDPEFSMPILKKVVSRAKAISSKRGEAKRVARAILEELQ